MFDLATLSAPSALQQSQEFSSALAVLNRPFTRLPCGALMLHRQFGKVQLSMLPRVNMTSSHELTDTLRDRAHKGPVILSPDSLIDLSAHGALPLISPAAVAELNLQQSPGELKSQMHQKWRNRLRHAGKQRLRMTRQDQPDDARHWLLQADQSLQRARGYRNWPTELTCAYARENRGSARLFTASDSTGPVAAALILLHGRQATYHIGHSTDAGRKASAQTLVLWDAVCWLRQMGILQLDLGVINTEDAPGLARFKLGIGARARTLGGTWLWWPPWSRVFCPLSRFDRALMRSVSTAEQ